MQQLRLKDTVTVRGPNLLGRQSSITFSPIENIGWFWLNDDTHRPIPICATLVSGRTRRITLCLNGTRLEIYEHIGALAWTGLTGVAIRSDRFPPYYGRIGEFWHALQPHCQPVSGEAHWQTPHEAVHVTSDDGQRFIDFLPHTTGTPTLTAVISVDFPGLGRARQRYTLATADVERGFDTHTLGWPPHWYWVSRLAPRILWPHHRHINWPHDNDRQTMLQSILDHRFGDLLGTLSLLGDGSLIAGEVTSHCAGHRLDIQLVRRLSGTLRQL
ncbi:MAG: hypothetical protein PHI63_06065 [Patescibacteria group bacterium]|nr:hypothetical protein [Patescibacteria group bacterium]